MKKILVILTAVTIAAAANAQVYVGGSLGVNYNTSNSSTSRSSSVIGGKISEEAANTTFAFTPTVGYRINGKWAVGLDLNLALRLRKQSDTYAGTIKDNLKESKEYKWDISPFVRYNLCKFKKFGIDLKLTGGIGTSREFLADSKKNTSTTYLNYGISLSPVITLDINDHFSLESTLGIASIGWTGSKATAEGDRVTFDSESVNSITLGLNNTTAIAFGCIYKF